MRISHATSNRVLLIGQKWHMENTISSLGNDASQIISTNRQNTNGAVTATKDVAIKKLSSFGKKAVAAVKATTHALGFINWNRAASYNFKGLPESFSFDEKEPIIFHPEYSK